MFIDQIISSGLLELYVIGDISPSEVELVEQAMEKDESVRQAVLEIENALEAYATEHAVPVSCTIKPMLLATANYMDRMQNGETPTSAPSLSENSKVSDFKQWLEREDMQEPNEYDSMHGRIISSDEVKTTMIVWLKDGAPDETHTDEIEKFLIVEGSCDIQIGEKVHSLSKGDYLSIPLFINHNVKVTSTKPCKVILERSAA